MEGTGEVIELVEDNDDDEVVEVDGFLGLGENRLIGVEVVLLKSTVSMDDGVKSVLFGTTGLKVVVDGL